MSSSDIRLDILRSRAELAHLAGLGDRSAYERAVAEHYQGKEQWTLPGYCQACDAAVQLAGDWRYSDGATPNFRERLVCPGCGLNNRQRFMARLVRERPQGTVYLYEQVTAFYAWAKKRLPSVLGSEYLGTDLASGIEVDGIRHEDALALSFADNAVDLIVSNDVYEHVPDIDAALREARRVLTPRGRLLFSVPFYSARDETVRRAEIRDGRIVELLPAEYHGNPIDSATGSLVFYEHGWDILDRCRDAGFADAYVLGYWSALYGYLGGGLQMIFVATCAR